MNTPQPEERVEESDLVFMTEALALARTAEAAGEVPVGAVLVRGGEIIGRGWNQPITAATRPPMRR